MNDTVASLSTGLEWAVEAFGCDPTKLADLATLEVLFSSAVSELGLHPVHPAIWHQFPSPGGITGMLMLAESHLTVHTFPEHGAACINLFCCTPRPVWAWNERLSQILGASDVSVRELRRDFRR